MIAVGLTGSIGMGKTATAQLLREEGVPVHDADAAVHELYDEGGAAVQPVRDLFPEAVVDGRVDRKRLAAAVVGRPEALKRLEAIVHPLVRDHRDAFLETALQSDARVIAYDVPLLFETGGDKAMDAVIVASAPADIQRRRVLERPGMTAEKLDAILARQMPDAEKRARADFVVETSRGLEDARAQVREILHIITAPQWRSARGET